MRYKQYTTIILKIHNNGAFDVTRLSILTYILSPFLLVWQHLFSIFFMGFLSSLLYVKLFFSYNFLPFSLLHIILIISSFHFMLPTKAILLFILILSSFQVSHLKLCFPVLQQNNYYYFVNFVSVGQFFFSYFILGFRTTSLHSLIVYFNIFKLLK